MAGVFLQTIFDEVRQALDGGDTELAIGIAQHILQHAPRVIDGHRLLGEAYLNAAQFAPASEAFAAVLQADPEYVAAYYGLGLAQRSLNQTSEAIRSLERALEIQPNLAELRTQLLQLYAETPNSAGQFRLSRSGLGRLYARGQMYTQAIDEFRAVLDNEPDRDDVRVALAEALWRDGQEDAAVEWCGLVTETSPELFKPTLIGGYLQLAAGEPEGEALWRRAAAQEPSLATAESLFEILPPLHIDEPIIPAFDEQAWRAAATSTPAVEVASTPTSPMVEVAVTPATPVEEVASARTSPDVEGAVTTANTDAVLPETEAVAVEQPLTMEPPDDDLLAQSDDALLASLLGFAGFADPNSSEDVGVAQPTDAAPQNAIATSTTNPEERTTLVLDMRSDSADSKRVSVARTYPAPDLVPNQTISREADSTEDILPPPVRTDLVVEPTSHGLEDHDLPGADAQPFPIYGRSGSTPTPFGRVEPFRLEDWDAPVGPTDVPEPPPPATISGTLPSSAQELSGSAPFGDIKPFSLDDLQDEPVEVEDTTPFSLTELGLSGDQASTTSSNRIHPSPLSSDAFESSSKEADASSPRLADLGLSDDELTRWETKAQSDDAPWNEASFYGASPATQEPVTPFSLADLGLTDEELERWNTDAAVPSGGLPSTEDDETTPFSLADYEPSTSTTATDAPEHPLSAAQASIHSAETQPFDVSALLAEVDAPEDANVATQGHPDVTSQDDDAPPPESPIFQRFHAQLALEPENHTLRLGLARANVQQDNTAQALEQYKQLVKRGVLLEPILEDLTDLLEGTQDRGTLRRLHRLVGDVYMQQGRMDEALTEYSWT